MSDFTESNLLRPTAPREILIYSKKKANHLMDLSVNGKDDVYKENCERASISSVLYKLLDYFNSHIKNYTHLKEQPQSCIKTNDESLERKPKRRSGLAFPRQKETGENEKDFLGASHECKTIRNRIQNMKFQILIKYYSTIKNNVYKETNSEENLIEDERKSNERISLRRKTRMKNFAKRKKVVCSNAFSNSKRVISSKKKLVRKKVLKSCRNWAYSVGNMSSFPQGCVPSGMNGVNQFQYDFSYISSDPTRIFY